MSKPRTLANFVSAGNPLADGTIDPADINGVTATAAELNILDGATVTTTELNYLDGVTSDIQTQFNNISVTTGSLTKSFANGETASITLSSAVSPAPVVSVTKEVPQTGISSKGAWDVATDGSNYDRHDTAYNVTLTPSNASADGTFTLGSGSFASTDVGKQIEGNGGKAILTATDGSYSLVTAFNDNSTIAAGDWGMFALTFDATAGVELSGVSTGVWDISNASFVQDFSVLAQESSPFGLFIRSDGLKLYIVGSGADAVSEYNLSTAWDVSTASFVQAFSVSGQTAAPHSVSFKTDGTKMFVADRTNSQVDEYSLGTAWDISTASFTQFFSVSGQQLSPFGMFFRQDGTKFYIVGDTPTDVHEYNLSTAWDVSTASFVQAFSVSGQEATPNGIFFRSDGIKMYVSGQGGDNIYEYNLSTAWNISTASFVQSFSVATQEGTPSEVFFKPDGAKMYTIGPNNDKIYEYNVGSITQPTAQYSPAITNAGGQINTTFWTDINSMTADQTAGNGQVFYAVSTDGRTTWSVIKDADGVRPIVRNNAGTWEYNSNATYGSVTWTAATTNEELYALQQALTDQAQNRMDKTQLDAVTDPNHYTLGNSLDLMIALYLGSNGTSPTSDGVSINYDAEALNKGAILGTDYDYDFPDSTTVRITSNAAQNLKIRVV